MNDSHHSKIRWHGTPGGGTHPKEVSPDNLAAVAKDNPIPALLEAAGHSQYRAPAFRLGSGLFLHASCAILGRCRHGCQFCHPLRHMGAARGVPIPPAIRGPLVEQADAGDPVAVSVGDGLPVRGSRRPKLRLAGEEPRRWSAS
jgi:hypothetical protein